MKINTFKISFEITLPSNHGHDSISVWELLTPAYPLSSQIENLKVEDITA